MPLTNTYFNNTQGNRTRARSGGMDPPWGARPMPLSLVAERRKPSGTLMKEYRKKTGRLAPLRYKPPDICEKASAVWRSPAVLGSTPCAG